MRVELHLVIQNCPHCLKNAIGKVVTSQKDILRTMKRTVLCLDCGKEYIENVNEEP